MQDTDPAAGVGRGIGVLLSIPDGPDQQIEMRNCPIGMWTHTLTEPIE
jgi:hypothetical protein